MPSAQSRPGTATSWDMIRDVIIRSIAIGGRSAANDWELFCVGVVFVVFCVVWAFFFVLFVAFGPQFIFGRHPNYATKTAAIATMSAAWDPESQAVSVANSDVVPSILLFGSLAFIWPSLQSVG